MTIGRPRDACPDCGDPKDRRSVRCRSCARARWQATDHYAAIARAARLADTTRRRAAHLSEIKGDT